MLKYGKSGYQTEPLTQEKLKKESLTSRLGVGVAFLDV
jgi:hypothetical protein